MGESGHNACDASWPGIANTTESAKLRVADFTLILRNRGNQLAEIDVNDYEGIRVLCDAQRWANKIDANHPELSGKQDEVAEAIRNPEIVLQDRDYPDRRHLIRRNADSLYIAAVVEYRYSRGSVTGRLVTAFVRYRLRPDDHVLYVNVRR